MLANLIFLADRVDALSVQHRLADDAVSMLAIAHKITEEIKEFSGTFLDPDLVKSFLEVSKKEGFWFRLEPESLHRYLQKYMASFKSESIDLFSLEQIAELFAMMVDAKSPYMADHSYDVAGLLRFLAAKMGLPPDVCSKIEIAGLLHDLGKLRVPDEILDKASALSDEEFDVIKIHAYETYQILSKINGLEDIAQWASQHHEKLNGQGYPCRADAGVLTLPARIIAVADVFQALAQKRPYRKNLKPLEILKIIDQKVGGNELDGDVAEAVRQIFKTAGRFQSDTPAG